MRVKTRGTVSARVASASTTQSAIGWRALRRISTTSNAVHAAVPASTISIGRRPTSRPPSSGGPSMTTLCPLPDSATKLTPCTHLILAFTPAPVAVTAERRAGASGRQYARVVLARALCQHHSTPVTFSPALPAAFLPFLLLGQESKSAAPVAALPFSPPEAPSDGKSMRGLGHLCVAKSRHVGHCLACLPAR